MDTFELIGLLKMRIFFSLLFINDKKPTVSVEIESSESSFCRPTIFLQGRTKFTYVEWKYQDGHKYMPLSETMLVSSVMGITS